MWVIDDNVRACYALDAQCLAAWEGGGHLAPPKLCSFDAAMLRLEKAAGVHSGSADYWHVAVRGRRQELEAAKCHWESATSGTRQLQVGPLNACISGMASRHTILHRSSVP